MLLERSTQNVYAVILAGGSGTRFWPKSRQALPKQLSCIGATDKTMLEQTLARLDGIVPPERRLIVTHQDQLAATRKIAGALCPSVLGEPDARNTANAIALAALHIQAISAPGSDPIMLCLAADHVIRKEKAFQDLLLQAIDIARQDYLALLGIVAQSPETGYGYIEAGPPLQPPTSGARQVASFREKPDRASAEAMLRAGNYFWNSGMFVWRNAVILRELERRLPAAVNTLRGISPHPALGYLDLPSGALAAAYKNLPKISIDHAVVELAEKLAVLPADIGWFDVGSWDALSRCFAAHESDNIAFGDNLMLDCHATTIDSDGPFVATIGTRDLVVVAAKGAILVCDRNRAQDVRQVVDWLKTHGRQELL